MDTLEFKLTDVFDRQVMFIFSLDESHMHSFNEHKPKSFSDVYKVYYTWHIEERDDEMSSVVFDMDCDECSALEHLYYKLKYILQHRKSHTRVLTLGQPGSDWDFEYVRGCKFDDETNERVFDVSLDYLLVSVFNNWTNKGYRFSLDRNTAYAFCEFLQDVNKQMLARGEPI